MGGLRVVAVAALCAVVGASAALAARGPAGADWPGQPQPGQQDAQRGEPEEIPPTLAAARTLGVKAAGVRQRLAVAPVVVVCPDEVSYLEAIAAWSPQCRFPVLIDDGSHDAAADIARFVRAFAPQQVLWFEADEAAQREGGDDREAGGAGSGA